MVGAKICGDSDTVLLQNDQFPCSPEVLDSFWISSSSCTFPGSNPMGKLEKPNAGNAIFLHQNSREEDIDEDAYETCLQPQAKKRRLTANQVQVLEKNFEAESKLDPERKVELAKELGLQPRQVAIWFQNRRARFKTKKLEKDCDSLRADYDKLKADYDSLRKENESLKNQVSRLRDKLLMKEKGNENVESDKGIKSKASEFGVSIAACENLSIGTIIEVKQEDANSVKSDVYDSESPNHAEVSQREQEDDPGQFFFDGTCFRDSCIVGSALEDLPDWSWLH